MNLFRRKEHRVVPYQQSKLIFTLYVHAFFPV